MAFRLSQAVMMMAAMLPVTASCLDAAPIAREDLGRSVKLTILVDKVMLSYTRWQMEEWMVEEAARAGFNVFCPRSGFDNLEEVRQVAQWCADRGIFYMPWMRGTLTAPDGPEADGKRLVWANGLEQPLWSPNSDELWEWLARYITEYARISAANEHLMGVFLDFENYAPGKPGNCYDLSYDDLIMSKFAEHKGIELPELACDQRRSWLEEQGLLEEFTQFQIDHWRERCRALREAVDEFNPSFQFCIYPAPGTLFMREACYPEWATEQAPLILADAVTYGRAAGLQPQAEALQFNRARLSENMQGAMAADLPLMYVGGIDPAVTGADPEFSGKNAVMISELTDGYWVFYEGPKYEGRHQEYFKWFAWANQAIAQGRLDAWLEPRETPEDWGFVLFNRVDLPPLTPPPVTGETIEFPRVMLRGEHLLLVAAKAGRPVEIVLRNYRIGPRQSLLVWDLRNWQKEQLATGTIPDQQQGTISFTPDQDGIYVIAASAASSCFALVSSNVPVGICTDTRLSLLGPAERLYFHVPEGLESFSISAKGSGYETVRIDIFDPGGGPAATIQTTPLENRVTLEVPTDGQAGAVWSMSIGEADEGVLEDNDTTFGAELPPVVSLVPEHVFRFAEQ